MKKTIPSLSFFFLLVMTGCQTSEENTDEVKIGYFPNLTHIPSIIALENGYLEDHFGEDIEITPNTFPDGSVFMEAMSTQDIDIGTVGPSPAMNTYQINPEHEVIAGAINGGAVLVTNETAGIEHVKDLDEASVAIPAITATQDMMLRAALMEEGLNAEDSGGSVSMLPQAPADTSTLFLQDDVDAAAVPEPWGVNLESQAGAEVLLDADEFAWGMETPTTVVTARTGFTEENEDLTKGYLRAHVDAIQFIEENPEESIDIFIEHIEELTGNELDQEKLHSANERLNATYELNVDIMQEMATISYDAQYTRTDDIKGLINLEYLEDVLGEEQ
ncbi:NitT/TauT family transport system substrate-binding protein [Geomicrobium halophilum]|uniref:NitT/TauT family transport system substrate-binding protein n=1 Tax=Geomicrobium halophilum TaxID=549000 RepID=A0A841Q098_9BACL|nr:ABC transporter substrate-binding protein [Geomicrobium halophilum]MBB6450993.1 NitT/TauT family transport system substrate-binding protein [Geomicrobium halophilum]